MNKQRYFFCPYLLIVLLSVILCGCGSSDRALLGRLQVGEAGGQCSFLTSIFAGPDIGRGRNEGRVKSEDEIASLFGVFAIKQKIEFSKIASTGIGLEEYLAMNRSSLSINLHKDTLCTAQSIQTRKLVPKEDIQKYYRYLFHGHFLNTDVLVDSIEHGDIERCEVREQFWRWIGYTFDKYKLDYYILDGNQNMLKKLYEKGVITKHEAVYLLGRWALERTRFEVSMLEDMEYFQVLSTQDISVLLKLELAYIDYFGINPSIRKSLLKQQESIFESLRIKTIWPLSIPLFSKIKAVAPTYRNLYKEHYQTDKYITIQTVQFPKTADHYFWLDPRIAVSLNDGRTLSTEEKLSRWWIGSITSAFGAGRGETQTGYIFTRRLDSPGSQFNLRLITYVRESGLISKKQYNSYINDTLNAGLCHRQTFISARDNNIPVLDTIMNNEMFLGRCFVFGISTSDYNYIRNSKNSGYQNKINDILRSKMDVSPLFISAETIMCAEMAGEITTQETEFLLKVHFYYLLERLAHAAYRTVWIDADWRQNSRQLQLEHALLEYKLNQSLEELFNVQSQ